MPLTARRAVSYSAAFAMAAAALSGCAAADGLMSSVALPATQTNGPDAENPPLVSSPTPQGAAGTRDPMPTVTEKQRVYLAALAAAGVHPSSALIALSIGSYVCQARTAGQATQMVWDFVYPLVESDVDRPHPDGFNADGYDVDAATRAYIRIADDQLC